MIAALLAYVHFGSAKRAAAYLGITRRALYYQLERLRQIFDSRSVTELAVRLYPWLGNYYTIEHAVPAGRREPSPRYVSRAAA